MKDTVSHYVSPHSPLTSTAPQDSQITYSLLGRELCRPTWRSGRVAEAIPRRQGAGTAGWTQRTPAFMCSTWADAWADRALKRLAVPARTVPAPSRPSVDRASEYTYEPNPNASGRHSPPPVRRRGRRPAATRPEQASRARPGRSLLGPLNQLPAECRRCSRRCPQTSDR